MQSCSIMNDIAKDAPEVWRAVYLSLYDPPLTVAKSVNYKELLLGRHQLFNVPAERKSKNGKFKIQENEDAFVNAMDQLVRENGGYFVAGKDKNLSRIPDISEALEFLGAIRIKLGPALINRQSSIGLYRAITHLRSFGGSDYYTDKCVYQPKLAALSAADVQEMLRITTMGSLTLIDGYRILGFMFSEVMEHHHNRPYLSPLPVTHLPVLSDTLEGSWKGMYSQIHSPYRGSQQGVMTLNLRLGMQLGSKTKINGEGTDPIGPFTVNGETNTDTGEVRFTKSYSAHSWEYVGFMTEFGLVGSWELKDVQRGVTYASSRSLYLVKFLHDNRKEAHTKDALDSAASSGRLDVLNFLYYIRTEGCLKIEAASTTLPSNFKNAIVALDILSNDDFQATFPNTIRLVSR
ncbi:hypothetical protein HDU97_005674 [Phlyctochytrium planicorne]|nr:hypothetical protein HDU97_005674 [Phlyctochytrium planicorne]